MQIRVFLFAAVRQSAGSDWIDLDVTPAADEGPVVAADVLTAVARQLPDIAALIPACRLAIDDSYVGDETPVPEDSEVALIPPTSGG